MAFIDPRLTRELGFDSEVQREVRAVAEQLGSQARGTLARHRVTGRARIEVEHRVDGSPDSLVSLVDEAALSIEFGRGEYTRRDGRHVAATQGLNILGGLL